MENNKFGNLPFENGNLLNPASIKIKKSIFNNLPFPFNTERNFYLSVGILLLITIYCYLRFVKKINDPLDSNNESSIDNKIIESLESNESSGFNESENLELEIVQQSESNNQSSNQNLEITNLSESEESMVKVPKEFIENIEYNNQQMLERMKFHEEKNISLENQISQLMEQTNKIEEFQNNEEMTNPNDPIQSNELMNPTDSTYSSYHPELETNLINEEDLNLEDESLPFLMGNNLIESDDEDEKIKEHDLTSTEIQSIQNQLNAMKFT